jgi:predicted nucleotidyltransferase
MIDSLESRLTEVTELCRKYRVKRFEVFGSAVDGDWKPATSDFDFLVDFLPMAPGEHSKSYFGLLFGLQDLFKRNVDLVEKPAIRNRRFLNEIEKTRQVLFVSSSYLVGQHADENGQ